METYPVLIGQARCSDRKGDISNPSSLFTFLIQKALEDVGNDKIKDMISDVVTIKMAIEQTLSGNEKIKPYKNLAQQISYNSSLKNVKRFYSTNSGGNTPQMLVNLFAKKISDGEVDAVVIVGGECLDTFKKHLAVQKELPDWGSDFEEKNVTLPITSRLGSELKEVSDIEKLNKIFMPRHMYPLLDQDYRHNVLKVSVEEQLKRNGRLFALFSQVSSLEENKKFSWFPKVHSAKEISTESPTNRWIAYPYTKYMNSIMNVNQGACVILVSKKIADGLEVKENQRVYLRGCGDCLEPSYFVPTRTQLSESHGMRESFNAALTQARISSSRIDYFDLYSCFPIAVNKALQYLEINFETEKRPLTVTGGLPYAGGPGNAYTLIAICAMMQKLRKQGTEIEYFGLVNGNGWFLSNHSCGIYSNRPEKNWIFNPENPASTQSRANMLAGQPVHLLEKPMGQGVVESYVIDFSQKKQKPRVIVIGKIGNHRFVASSSKNLNKWMERDVIGINVQVQTFPNGKIECWVENENDFERFPKTNIQMNRSELVSNI